MNYVSKTSFYLSTIAINLFILFTHLTLYPYINTIFIDMPSMTIACLTYGLLGLLSNKDSPFDDYVAAGAFMLNVMALINFLAIINMPVLE